ncbi:MAG: hypothetical protein IT359_08140 [Gemmatimonadaceae bacterium]|nr:hypothetical protein [Gemmatimonadaceae bacterium]
MTAPTAPTDSADLIASAPPASVRFTDRVVDGVAALLLVGGVSLFFLGRSALQSLAAGTYPAPLGETWVARTEFHDSQTRLGIWLIAAGAAIALVGAVRHFLHSRRAR